MLLLEKSGNSLEGGTAGGLLKMDTELPFFMVFFLEIKTSCL